MDGFEGRSRKVGECCLDRQGFAILPVNNVILWRLKTDTAFEAQRLGPVREYAKRVLNSSLSYSTLYLPVPYISKTQPKSSKVNVSSMIPSNLLLD